MNDFNAGGELYLLSFPPSSTGNKLCFDVTIISDVIIEGNEQFVVKFLNVPDEANRVDVGEISQACVTITDDGQYYFFCLIIILYYYHILLKISHLRK